MVTAAEQKSHRVDWTPEEIDVAAKAFVEKRLANPFEFPVLLFVEAAKASLPAHRHRKLATLTPQYKARIMHFWKEKLAQPAEPVEPPAPILLTVETQRPFDYAQALATFDTVTLVALLVGKLSQESAAVQAQLATIATRLGAQAAQAMPKAPAPAPIAFPKAEKRKARVAIIGPLDSQFTEIKQRVEADNIPVDIRALDKDHQPGIPSSCDFAIVTRHTRHKWWDAARSQLANSHVFFMDTSISGIVQKLRDIASLQAAA